MAGKFTADIRKWVAKAQGNSRLVVRKVAIDLGTSIVMKTPVGDPDTWKQPERAPAGYVGGRARGSWQYEKDTPIQQEPGTVDGSGAASIGRVVGGVMTGDPLCEHFITSSVPYMRELEYEGHSKQAPDGMVRKTVAEFKEYVENAVREVQ